MKEKRVYMYDKHGEHIPERDFILDSQNAVWYSDI